MKACKHPVIVLLLMPNYNDKKGERMDQLAVIVIVLLFCVVSLIIYETHPEVFGILAIISFIIFAIRLAPYRWLISALSAVGELAIGVVLSRYEDDDVEKGFGIVAGTFSISILTVYAMRYLKFTSTIPVLRNIKGVVFRLVSFVPNLFGREVDLGKGEYGVAFVIGIVALLILLCVSVMMHGIKIDVCFVGALLFQFSMYYFLDILSTMTSILVGAGTGIAFIIYIIKKISELPTGSIDITIAAGNDDRSSPDFWHLYDEGAEFYTDSYFDIEYGTRLNKENWKITRKKGRDIYLYDLGDGWFIDEDGDKWKKKE